MKSYRTNSNDIYTLLGALAMIVVALVAICFAFYGYVLNFISILHSGPIATWGGMMVGRIIGIFVPFIGAILGYF